MRAFNLLQETHTPRAQGRETQGDEENGGVPFPHEKQWTRKVTWLRCPSMQAEERIVARINPGLGNKYEKQKVNQYAQV
jgi:hypothetical protein